ncbi:MAG: AMIN domain-containing protein [Candidatus Sulfotelmatobacter sp.]
MMVVQKHLWAVLVLASCAAAQNGTTAPATVQNVTVAREGTDLRVEITLSAPVTPSVDTAVKPNRILLDLPETIPGTSPKAVPVNDNGVRQVRTGQHSTLPLVTRIVVDLDQLHLYSVTTEGNRIILSVVAPDKRAMSRSVPVAATGGNLAGIFRRHRDDKPVTDTPTDTAVPAPPPAVAGPAFEPSKQNSSAPPVPPPAVAAASPAPSPGGSQGHPAAPPTFEQRQFAVQPGAAQQLATPSSAASTAAAQTSPTVSPATSKSVPVTPIAAAPAPATVTPPPVPAERVSAPVAVAANTSTAVTQPVASLPAANRRPVTSVAPAPVAVAPTPDSAATPAANTAKNASPDVVAPAETAATEVAGNAAGDAASPVAVSAPDTSAEAVATLIARADDPSLRTVFRVKYVAEGVAYLEGGRAQGLKEGMKLEVIDKNVPATQGDSANAADPRVVAELDVSAVADSSSVSDIHTPKRPVKVGDLAYLSTGDTEAMVQQRALSPTRQYPAVISFTEGDTLDEEAREEVPRPPLPSVNRARGRIGFDNIETISHGANSITSNDVGVVFRGDITRIGGTYWNLSGYWRGRITKESVASQQTLQNLINRTYHLNMTYDNPNSTIVAGVGRLYLPYAPSLDTIDGGYFGKRISKGTTLGVFGGSTPDPSSWDYSPNRVISGAFVNFDGGDFNGVHYSTTAGGGVSMISWNVDRPFVFIEDSLSYKRTFALYESAQIDNPLGNSVTPSPGWGLGRNFSTFRVNPLSRVELDFNYNYFRQIPTFDPSLAALGLLDKYLFQGFSAGGRVEVWNQIWLSTNLGRSSGTGDAKSSLNQMYGITFNRVPLIRLRADVHYAKFDSSFGSGNYKSFSLSRQMSDRLRLEVLLGQQTFASALTNNNHSKFVTGTVETTLGPHYYLQGNFTTNRGDMNYDQMMFSIGYRFDSRRKGEK